MSTKNTSNRAPKTHVMVTLPPESRSAVETLAEREDRSMSSICRRFIEQGLATTKTTHYPEQ
ncbi:hypothetical protein [Marinimicrobium sp. ARAG 43.8]|uniref:hypothetical protein n=1 Tax=Marinimicrobium sp. ARAG 43.8 TaxID=3418719 RepID=UPI003CE7ED9D